MRVGLYSALLLVSCTLFFAIPGKEVGAQFSGLSQTEAALVTSPAYPRPQTDVLVAVSAYSMSTAGADIRWYVDGAEVTSVRNDRDITIRTGVIGTTRTVRAVLTVPGSSPLTLTTSISPGDVDIIIEADTYTPPFYKGRALPSAESQVRAIAIPHIGASVNPATLSYEWKLGETVLHGGPVKGKQTVDFTTPLFDGSQLTVTLYNTAGSPIMRRSITLKNSAPEIFFYEESQLRGQNEKAVGSEYTLIGEETTFRAEPYYLDRRSVETMSRPEWRVGGSVVDTANSDPFTITLRKTGGSGSTPINIILTNTKKLFQNVRGSFMIYFN